MVCERKIKKLENKLAVKNEQFMNLNYYKDVDQVRKDSQLVTGLKKRIDEQKTIWERLVDAMDS